MDKHGSWMMLWAFKTIIHRLFMMKNGPFKAPNLRFSPPMIQIHPTLWAIEEPMPFGGLDIGARLLIVRRNDGSLWVHAPFSISDEDAAAIRALGEVRDVVVPNNFHYKEVGEFSRRFSGAQVWAPPKVASKLKDVPHQPLEEIPTPWREDFDAILFQSRLFDEWVFCHRASRTLILTDLALNLPRPRTPLARVVARIGDMGRGFKPSRLERLMLRTGKLSEHKKRLETVLKWDFERITMAHGQIVESGGKTALRRGYRWLLGG